MKTEETKAPRRHADGSSSVFFYPFCFGPSCAPDDGLSAAGELKSDGSDTYTYFDSYGRDLQHATRLGPTWVGAAIQRRSYDALGNLDTETQPFLLGDPQYLVDYTHDGFGRLAQVTRPISEGQSAQPITTITYDRLSTTVTTVGNPANQTTTYVNDGIGRIVQVTDSLSGQTNYKYNAFDQLTEVRDPANHTTTIGYNNRGDKTSLTDPDLGAWTYPEYTVFGELRKQVDAKNQTVLFQYDQLGRLDWRTEPEFPNGPGPDDDDKTDFTYYTTGDYRHGLPKDEIFPGNTFQRTYAYDASRRLTAETTTIDGTARTTNFDYYASGAAQGKLQFITYPTSTSSVRVKLEHVYNAVGRLWKINDVTTGTSFNGGVLYQLNSSDALLRETSATLGNGAIPTTRVYDRANLFLKSIQTGASNAVQNLQYDWFPNGNLEEIKDLRIGRTDNFTYDALSRLDTQSLNGVQILNLDYTPGGDGNLAFKTGVGTYATYGGTSGGPHAVTSITGVQSNAYTYDANGNMTNRDGDTITWFSHNRPKKINYGASSSEFWHGSDRSRYKHVAISGGTTATTRYFGPHFEVETRGGLTIYRHYIFAGDQAVAQYERRAGGSPAEDIQYLHRDHLASVVATTSAAGTVRQRWEYDAFGVRSRSLGSGPDDTERGYTGHEHLDAVELTHMNGRVQDPELGRFLSADPFVQAPYHSQSLNRYSYAWNNPLTRVDPSGFTNVINADWLDSAFIFPFPFPVNVPASGVQLSALTDGPVMAQGPRDVRSELFPGSPSQYGALPSDNLMACGQCLLGIGIGAGVIYYWNFTDSGRQTQQHLAEAITAAMTNKKDDKPASEQVKESLAVTGTPNPDPDDDGDEGGGGELDIEKLVASGNEPVAPNGLSRAARSLDSHTQRQGGTFSANPNATIAERNAYAEQELRRILTAPDGQITRLTRGGFEVRTGNGQGVRFNSGDVFSNFLDPGW